MKCVYTHDNKLLVENAKNLLLNEGIEAFIKNDFASSGVGELSAIDTWPELWVQDERHYAAASQIIEQLTSKYDGAEWFCKHCNEFNSAAFEVCWKCQTERVLS